MLKRFSLGAFAVAVTAVLGGTPALESKGPPSSPWPVSVSLRNSATDGVVSDSGSCSVDQYCSGEQNVRAEMLANGQGNFVFDTNDGSNTDGGRRLVLHFGAQTVPAALTVLDVDAFIGTIGVTGTNVDGNLRTMTVGQTLPRRTRIAWVQGKVQFTFRWDGLNDHSFLDFTCDLTDALGCKQWTASPPGTAGLYSVPTKGNATETYYGTYTMPFSMTLVRQ